MDSPLQTYLFVLSQLILFKQKHPIVGEERSLQDARKILEQAIANEQAAIQVRISMNAEERGEAGL